MSDEESAEVEGPSELERNLGTAVRYGIPGVTVIAAVIGGYREGAPLAVLVLAGGALVSIIAIFWASIRTLLGESQITGAEAYAIAAPRAEEEQKRAVLRALKDLEFERSVGKISEEDYRELVVHYRTEAKRLLRLIEQQARPRDANVEALVLERLRREGLAGDDDEGAPPPRVADAAEMEAPAAADADGDEAAEAEAEAIEKAPKGRARRRRDVRAAKPAPRETTADERDEEEALPAAAATPTCGKCGASNDADAVFCKKCGARQAAEEHEA